MSPYSRLQITLLGALFFYTLRNIFRSEVLWINSYASLYVVEQMHNIPLKKAAAMESYLRWCWSAVGGFELIFIFKHYDLFGMITAGMQTAARY